MSKPNIGRRKPPVKKSAAIPVAQKPGGLKTAAAKSAHRNIIIALAVVLALTLVSYFPSLYNGLVNWDDPAYVIQDPILATDKPADYFTKDKFVMGNYHPLTMLSFSMEYAASKLSPKRYHFDNLILHLFNTALVFFFVFLLAGHWQAAAIASALFGVHPMHVESVTWVSERKDVLYTFFYMASLITYIYYTRSKKPALYAGALALFILSLLSKGQAVTLPLSMLLVDYFCNRKFTAKTIAEKIPFFVLSLIFGIIAIIAQHTSNAIDTNRGFGFNSFLFAFYGLGSYLFRFIAPLQLSCFYPVPGGALPVIFYIAPVLVIGLIALVYFKFRKNKSVVFGALFFLLNIAPLLQLLPVGSSLISDRYTYIPYIGLSFIVAQAVMYFSGYNVKNGFTHRTAPAMPSPYKNIALTVVILAIAGYAYAGNERCKVWKNDETLFNNVLENYPGAGCAYNNLGILYYVQSKGLTTQNKPGMAKSLMEKAVGNFRKACDITPDYLDALHNLGLGYTSLGKYDSAVYYLSESIRLQPQNSVLWVNRCIAYRSKGQPDSALADINHAIALSPGDPSDYNSRANIYFSKGLYREAIKDYNTSIAADPNAGMQYNGLGHSYNQLGIYDSAIYYYNKSLAINPQQPEIYLKRGLAYLGKRNYNDAIKDYTTVINMNISNAEAYAMRSQAYLAIGSKKQALTDALQARQLGFPVQGAYLAQLEENKK